MSVNKLSIIIPTINRYEDLKNTIVYLQNQSMADFELIVIDQTAPLTSEDISSIDSRIVYVHSIIKSASAARNIGILKAKSEILLFLDDDVLITNKDFLQYYLDSYSNNRHINGVIGPIIDHHNNYQKTTRHWLSYNKHWGWLFFPRSYDKQCLINDGGAGNLSVKRQLAIEVGGMDCNFVKGAHREESDFNYRYTNRYGPYLFNPLCKLVHIGRLTGGIRSWNKRPAADIKAQHHYDGAFYFLFKNISLRHYLPHLLSTFLVFFFKKGLLKNPSLLVLTISRSIKGIRNALRMLRKGPKYIHRALLE